MNCDGFESGLLAGIAEHNAMGDALAPEHYGTVAEMHAAILG